MQPINSIPSAPYEVYKEWEGWGKFLGTGNKSKTKTFQSKRQSLEHWISTAERLSAQHGMLPKRGHLRTMHLNGLAHALMNHPEAFAHVPQDISKRTGARKKVEDHVEEAERLAKEHGKLPNRKWLQQNGYTALDYHLRKRPEVFAHVAQDNKHRTADEWCRLAVELQNKNDGVLPSTTWLRRQNYGGLISAMRNKPDLFKGINKIIRPRRSLEGYVRIAENLAAQNGGLLPTYAELQKRKLYTVNKKIQEYPEAFQHLTRDRRYKTMEEWIEVSRELVRNRGDMPNPRWLRNNGYEGLWECMLRHKKAFLDLGLLPEYKYRIVNGKRVRNAS